MSQSGESAEPTDPGRRLSPLAALLWSKHRISRHTLASVRRESKLKVVFVFLSTLVLLGGIFQISRVAFHLFESFGGELLSSGSLSLSDVVMARMLSVFTLALFAMLTVSNVLVAYQTLYRAREMVYLVQSPISTVELFLGRFVECVTFSSWASAFLGAPVMLAYGLETGASPIFYIALVAFYVPFVSIPAALGTMVAMALVRVLPRLRRSAWLALGLVVVLGVFGLFRDRFQVPDLSSASDLQGLVEAMGRTQSPYLPSQWVAQGVLEAAIGDYAEAGFYFLLLSANALLLVWLASAVAERLLYPGWSELFGGDSKASKPLRSPLRHLDRWLRFLPEPYRSLAIKDFRMFWRDPAQWGQFVLFFGILALYVANLKEATGGGAEQELWRAGRTLLNLGASMLILASLTTRFIFPLVSLEGRRFWILGLAPVTRRQIVWQKVWLSVGSISVFTVSLALLSAVRLALDPLGLVLSVAGMAAATFALSGLAVGLGSLYPNFQEDNPSRVVSGMGGTLCFLLSMVYVVLILAGQAVVLLWSRVGEAAAPGTFGWAVALVALWMVGLTVLVGYLPLRLGLHHLEQVEL